MSNYTIFGRFENPRRGRQARNLTTNIPKILDIKLPSEQIFSENCRWVPLDKVEKTNVRPIKVDLKKVKRADQTTAETNFQITA